MYSKTKINEELTMASFGYNSTDLNLKPNSKVIVTCENCHENMCRTIKNINMKHRCSAICGNKKRCFKCEEWLDLSMFNKYQKGSGGVAKLCKKCYNNYNSVKNYEYRRKLRLKNSLNNDIKIYIQKRVYDIKNKCKRNEIDCNITLEYMLNQWNIQNGLCFYTNLPMSSTLKTMGYQCWDSPSVDRIDSSKGYIQNNVVWCIFGVNSFKQTLSIEEFKNQISKIQWWFNKE